MEPIPFQGLKQKHLPENSGVYLISEILGQAELALYIGRTKNLRNRLYTNHLMGPVSNARLKNYMIKDPEHLCAGNVQTAKQYIGDNCVVRWIFEDDIRKRGALEGYFTALFFPKYGIAEEH